MNTKCLTKKANIICWPFLIIPKVMYYFASKEPPTRRSQVPLGTNIQALP